MLVTIDSNVLKLPQLIAEKLPESAVRWCTKLNQCDDVNTDIATLLFNSKAEDGRSMRIVYNTPISMATDVTYYNLSKPAIHFVYLDYNKNHTELKRILINISKLQNVIIISNGSIYATGQYVLYIGNCTDDDIADVISGIIVVHLKENRTIHEKELIALLCDKKYTPLPDEINEPKKIDIYTILDSKRSNYGEISDCFECA